MEISYEEIIDTIKEIISSKGMKQNVVAERAGFTPQELSNILNDNRKLLRVEHLPRIAVALGVEVNELFKKKGCEHYGTGIQTIVQR